MTMKYNKYIKKIYIIIFYKKEQEKMTTAKKQNYTCRAREGSKGEREGFIAWRGKGIAREEKTLAIL